MLAALGDGFEILFHDVDGVVDLLLMGSSVSDCALKGMRRANEACSGVGSSVNGRVCDESEVCQCKGRPLQMKVSTFAMARYSAVTCFATFEGSFAH